MMSDDKQKKEEINKSFEKPSEEAKQDSNSIETQLSLIYMQDLGPDISSLKPSWQKNYLTNNIDYDKLKSERTDLSDQEEEDVTYSDEDTENKAQTSKYKLDENDDNTTLNSPSTPYIWQDGRAKLIKASKNDTRKVEFEINARQDEQDSYESNTAEEEYKGIEEIDLTPDEPLRRSTQTKTQRGREVIGVYHNGLDNNNLSAPHGNNINFNREGISYRLPLPPATVMNGRNSSFTYRYYYSRGDNVDCFTEHVHETTSQTLLSSLDPALLKLMVSRAPR